MFARTSCTSQAKFFRLSARSNKKTYQGLSEKQKKICKLLEEKEQIEKYFYHPVTGFYRTCKRLKNNAVDFESLSETNLNIFDQQYKALQRINNKLENFSENEIDYSLDLFRKLNTARNTTNF